MALGSLDFPFPGPSVESFKEDLWYKIVAELQSPFLKESGPQLS